MKSIDFALECLLFGALVSQGVSICDDSNEVLADVCFRLYQLVEDTLLNDEGNLYRLQKAFFYAPNADPVLLKVIYNITFAENVTEDVQLQSNYCPNHTVPMKLEKKNFTLGWTSTGVFTVFHPLTLNFMQIQIPFVFMRVMFEIFKKIDPKESGPEAATLLWDGRCPELPSMHMNLHFTSLPCIPSEKLFNSTLMDVNSLLRIHAGRRKTGIIQDSGNVHLVGFSLKDHFVTSHNISDKTSDFWIYIVYVLSTIILYVICVMTIFFLIIKTDKKGNGVSPNTEGENDEGNGVSPNTEGENEEGNSRTENKDKGKSEVKSNKNNKVKSFAEKHPEILKGVIIVAVVFIVLEIVTELAMAIIWARNVHDGVTVAIFLAGLLYYSPGIVSLCFVIGVCYNHCTCHKNFRIGEKCKLGMVVLLRCEKCKTHKGDTLFKCFVWTMAYFVYIIMYAFFPAFVLAFAYPTRIITIFVFVATFMLLSGVYVTAYIKLEKTVVEKILYIIKKLEKKKCEPLLALEKENGNGISPNTEDAKKEGKAIVIKIFIWLIMTVSLVYFFLFIFALLYALIIGRASVVSSAPLAILSLLPSILISVVAWTMKSTFLDNNENEDKKESGKKDNDEKGAKKESSPNTFTDKEVPDIIQIFQQLHLYHHILSTAISSRHHGSIMQFPVINDSNITYTNKQTEQSTESS